MVDSISQTLRLLKIMIPSKEKKSPFRGHLWVFMQKLLRTTFYNCSPLLLRADSENAASKDCKPLSDNILDFQQHWVVTT